MYISPDQSFWWVFFWVFLQFSGRFLIFGLMSYCILWLFFPNYFRKFRLFKGSPLKRQIKHEIYWSFSTFLIFGLLGLGLLALMQADMTRVVFNWSEFPIWYHFLSLFLMFFIHESYFYWTHRLLHLPVLYKKVHSIHHASRHITPFSAYSFHPLEALIVGLIFILIPLFIPSHIVTLTIFAFVVSFANMVGHLGHEVFPRGYAKNPWIGWNNTSTYHFMHHRFLSYNFGLYTRIWDILMGTDHKDYQNWYYRARNGKISSN